MDNTNLYLAVFLGAKDGKKMNAWNALPEAERAAKAKEGMAAWGAWCEKYKTSIEVMGGPLGKTKQVGEAGVSDVTNELCAYMVVKASSHEEAAKMFEKHVHYTIFPGDSVQVMPVMPIPTSC